mmetsp:Transcript_147316/g.382997  ORF Transcript_147316/g.382997 Transcript_147316/m.382997 type:complete len:223 (-) Transcript_147316:1145-1813(-)
MDCCRATTQHFVYSMDQPLSEDFAAKGVFHLSCALHSIPADLTRHNRALRGHGVYSGQQPAVAAETMAIERHATSPRSGRGFCSFGFGAGEPREVGAEAVNGPLVTWRHLVAELTCLAKNVTAETEQAEIHLGSAFPIRGLELEEGRAQKVFAVACALLHGHKVSLNCRLVLAVASILADEPWNGRELVVDLGNHLIDKAPRRLCVQTVDPSGLECSLKLCL